MTPSFPRRRFRFLPYTTQAVAWLAIGVVLVLSLLDLLGWLFNVSLLKSVSPQWIPMKAITALCFIFLAAALALILKGAGEQGSKEKGTRGRRLAARIPASVVILVGLLTILDYAIDAANGQGNPMHGIPFVHAFLSPDARMVLLTALLFMFFGSATLLLASGRARAAGVAHALVFPAAIASYLIPASYLLGVQSLHDWLGTPVALNSGVAFCAVGATVFLARRDTWLMKVFTGESGGSVMARRLLPGLMVLPLVVGWLRLYGERTGFYKSEVGVALVALTYTVCFVWLVWFAARSTNRTDEQRRKAERAVADSEQALRRLNAELEQRVRDATAEVRRANEVLEQRVAERAGELQKANEFLLASRRAALNLTEDAVEARKNAEQTARELGPAEHGVAEYRGEPARDQRVPGEAAGQCQRADYCVGPAVPNYPVQPRVRTPDRPPGPGRGRQGYRTAVSAEPEGGDNGLDLGRVERRTLGGRRDSDSARGG